MQRPPLKTPTTIKINSDILCYIRGSHRSKKYHKYVIGIYLACCEICALYGNNAEIEKVAELVSRLSGYSKEIASKYVTHLDKIGLINYERVRVNGKFSIPRISIVSYESPMSSFFKGEEE